MDLLGTGFHLLLGDSCNMPTRSTIHQLEASQLFTQEVNTGIKVVLVGWGGAHRGPKVLEGLDLPSLHELVYLSLLRQLVVSSKVQERFPELANKLIESPVPVPSIKSDGVQHTLSLLQQQSLGISSHELSQKGNEGSSSIPSSLMGHDGGPSCSSMTLAPKEGPDSSVV